MRSGTTTAAFTYLVFGQGSACANSTAPVVGTEGDFCGKQSLTYNYDNSTEYTVGASYYGYFRSGAEGSVTSGQNQGLAVFARQSGDPQVLQQTNSATDTYTVIYELKIEVTAMGSTCTYTANGTTGSWDTVPPTELSTVALVYAGSGTVTIPDDYATEAAAITVGDNVIADVSACTSIAKISGGTIQIDATTKSVTPSDALKLAYRQYNGKVVFKGSGDYGVNNCLGSNTGTITSSLIFDGGTSSFEYHSGVLGSGDTADNPTLLVKGDATVTYTGHDTAGWSGSYLSDCIVRVNKGSTLVCKDDGTNTFYSRYQWYLEPGATMTISCTNDRFRVEGGADNTAQFYVPAGTGTATINGKGRIYLAHDETLGFAFNVGAGSTLAVGNDFAIQPGYSLSVPINKYGDGTVALAGSFTDYAGTLTAKEGTIDFNSNTSLGGTLKVENGATIRFNPGKGTTLTPTIDTTSDGKVVLASGTLNLGAARPTVDADYYSEVNLAATSDEIAAGKITIGTAGTYAATLADRLTVLDASGDEVSVTSATVEDGTLTLNLQTLPVISESKSISELGLQSDASGILIIQGAEEEDDAITVTFDAALPSDVTITVRGYVNFKLGGDQTAYPYSIMTFESGAAGIITVDSDCTLTVPANMIAKATGDIAVTLTNNGTFNVVSGTCTVTAASGQSIKGTVNIAKGAKMVNKTNDAIAYSGSTIVNVKGTLDMGTTRWTVGGSSQLNFYGGCTVTGSGDDGNFDLYRTGKVIYVYAGDDDDDSNTVTLNRIRARSGNSSSQADITIADGMTLVLEHGMTDYESNYVAKFGAGTLQIKDTLSADNIVVRAGTLELAADADATTTVSTPLSSSGTVTIGGAGIVKTTAVITNTTVKVSEGATLELAKSEYNYAFTINSCALDGTLVIDSGVTYTALAGDAPDYVSANPGGKGNVVVKGTLDLGGNRWSFNTGNKLTVYGGATVKGTGDGYGTIDYFNNGGVIEALGSGEVTWEANSRIRANTTFSIAEGVTLNHTGTLSDHATTITKTGAGTLALTVEPKSHTFSLAAGTIQSTNALTVNPADSRFAVSETTEDPNYHVYSLTRTTPGTVYATSFSFDSFEFEDGTAVSLIDGDTVIIPADCDTSTTSAWQCKPAKLAGHDVVINHEMNWKSTVSGNMTIASGATVYFYDTDTSISDGAVVSGEGTVQITDYYATNQWVPVNGDVQILCNIAFQTENEGGQAVDMSLHLTDGATLTVNSALADGKVTTSVAGKKVVYNDGVYSLANADHTVYFVGNGVVTAFANTATPAFNKAEGQTYDYDYTIEDNGTVTFTVTIDASYDSETLAFTGATVTKSGDVWTIANITADTTITATATKAPTGPTVPTSEGTIAVDASGNAVITPNTGVTSITVTGTVNGNVTIPSTVTSITVTKTGDLIVTGRDAKATPITKYLTITQSGTTYTIGDVNKAAVEADNGLEPTAVSTTGVSVNAIAGLTYTLIGSKTLVATTSMADASESQSPSETGTITFEDTKINTDKTATKMFYAIKVTK